MTVEIHGFCDERFLPLKDAFVANFDAGLELGASLALTLQGKTVIDLWAGWADLARTRPWMRDTIVLVASTTKLTTAFSALMLIDRGLVDLDAPVARYWPEFAQGGKGGVTVRHALSHRGGVPGLDPPVGPETARDWAAMTAHLAAEPHWFGGRPQVAYHWGTFGYLLGEVIRRVDGRGPRQFFEEEIARPLGCDFHVGLTDKADLSRLAEVQWGEAAPPPPDANPIALKIVASVPLPVETTWESLSNEDGTGNGFANARSIARLGLIVALGGEVDGVRYLSREILAEACREQVFDTCPYAGPMSLGLGLGRFNPEAFPVLTPDTVGWGGLGGSNAFMVRDAGVTFGYAPNNFILEASPVGVRQLPLIHALGQALPTM
ncbi:MAG TPA: serine hydrolase domain-containing protein [Caulobacteraceae bacterium]|nr:serine hydrolase domain-containing protein [Caulobacteraceae bacterium]